MPMKRAKTEDVLKEAAKIKKDLAGSIVNTKGEVRKGGKVVAKTFVKNTDKTRVCPVLADGSEDWANAYVISTPGATPEDPPPEQTKAEREAAEQAGRDAEAAKRQALKDELKAEILAELKS